MTKIDVHYFYETINVVFINNNIIFLQNQLLFHMLFTRNTHLLNYFHFIIISFNSIVFDKFQALFEHFSWILLSVGIYLLAHMAQIKVEQKQQIKKGMVHQPMINMTNEYMKGVLAQYPSIWVLSYCTLLYDPFIQRWKIILIHLILSYKDSISNKRIV